MFVYADPTVCPRCRAALAPAATRCTACCAALDDTRAYDVFLALQQVDRLVGQLGDVAAPSAAPAASPAQHAAPVASPVAPAPPTPPTPTAPPTAPAAAPIPPAPPMPPAPQTPFPVQVPTAPRVSPIMSGLTVPRILLGLGALCLVVAALVFLVVAWAALGVGGRTAVLVGFTLLAAGLAAWSARSGLRAGAESLTTVALGLLVLDLAGAKSSGWFGDLGASGFALLAGSVVTVVGAAATLATRRTKEPRLLSAEIAASGGIVAAMAGLQGSATFSPAAWVLTCLAVTAVLAVVGWRLRLGLPTWTAAALTVMAWVGLAAIGVVRTVTHPSWAELAAHVRVWPLLVTALIAAVPAAITRLPVGARVAGVAVAVLLLTLPAAVPGLDEGAVPAVLVLVAVVAVHAAAGWLLHRPWNLVGAAPLTLAGCTTGLAAAAAALGSVGTSSLLAHGLWDATATERIVPDEMDAVWALLMPLAAAATAVAVVTLARLVSATLWRALVAPAGACVLAVCAFCPVIVGAPRWTVVAALMLVAAGLVAWALRRSDLVSGLVALPLVTVAFAAALADDGLTVTVLALFTAALAAAGTPAAPRWARKGSPWLLPASAAATTWAVASVLAVDGGWRAVPVLAVVAALAVLRPAVAHEVTGLGVALLAMAVSAEFGDPDLRLVAAELAALALVATYLGVRHRAAASLVGLALLGAACLVAATDTFTVTVVLALTTAVSVLHELRKVDPAALVARVTTPVAAGALLWTAGDLAGLPLVWQGVPVVVALGTLLAWRTDLTRELPCAATAVVATGAALSSASADATWCAAYLTLLGAFATLAGVRHRPAASLAGLALLAGASLVAWDDTATATVVLALTTAVTLLHELRRVEPAALVARVATPVALGALVWTLGDLAGLPQVWQGVPVVVVLGALAVWRSELVREVPCAVVALGAALVSLADVSDDHTWAAAYLTLFGVILTATSLLHADRRRAAWGGLACLTLATWLRLEDLGVGTVEAYTLPLAAVLLVVGTISLLRTDHSSLRTQGAGLGLAIVPTLLQVLADPVSLRGALLGAGAIVLIAVGVTRRWAAPLVAGAGTLTLLVLRQVPVAQVLPQWVLIALAGAALMFVGLTWERRLANVRAAAGYVRGLR